MYNATCEFQMEIDVQIAEEERSKMIGHEEVGNEETGNVEIGNSARLLTPEDAVPVSDLTVERLKALADPSRLKILEFLLEPRVDCCARDDGVCGCDFEALLGLSQPTVSHHLKILVAAELLSVEKRGRWSYYGLRKEAFSELSGYLGRFGETTPGC